MSASTKLASRAVHRAIARAERILPGVPAAEGKRDPRWQAIIRVSELIETQPETVWEFARRWGRHAQDDLRAAVATCLLEHLLEHYFELLFPRVRREALASRRFADTFNTCWLLGQAELPENAERIRRLKSRVCARSDGRSGTPQADRRSRKTASRRSNPGPAG
jgi:hypothetical protein